MRFMRFNTVLLAPLSLSLIPVVFWRSSVALSTHPSQKVLSNDAGSGNLLSSVDLTLCSNARAKLNWPEPDEANIFQSAAYALWNLLQSRSQDENVVANRSGKSTSGPDIAPSTDAERNNAEDSVSFEKSIAASLNMFTQSMGTFGHEEWDFVRHCVVDEANRWNTVQNIVFLGLPSVLDHPYMRSTWEELTTADKDNQMEILKLVDKHGNNLLHLAVLSGDLQTVNSVLRRLLSSQARNLLEKVNLYSKTPKEVAELSQRINPTIVKKLKDVYRLSAKRLRRVSAPFIN